MKVLISIELELPDNTLSILKECKETLSQLVFDNFINYAARNHAKDVIKWGAMTNDIMATHHNTWGDICSNAKWNINETK